MKQSMITALLFTTCAVFADDNRVLLPPFENLSSRRAPTEYEITAGPLSEKKPTKNMVDRYSHIPREILEDIVTQIKGVHPVERQRLDQFYLENPQDTGRQTVEGENVLKAMLALKAPAAVQGTILTVFEKRVENNGYVHLKAHVWTARVRVRIYNLVGGKLEIPFSRLLTGNYTIFDSPTTMESTSEDEIALNVLRSALEDLRDDDQFSDAVRAASHQTENEMSDSVSAKIPFDVVPEGADVYVDDIWRGTTPCRLSLPLDKKLLVRIEKKPSYETWQAQIVPSRNLRIVRELQPVSIPLETEIKNPSKTKGKP